MRKPHSGFTLLELMLVITIAGLLLGLGVPAMGNYFRNARITAAANDVMAALHFTRSEAIKRRQPVTLCTSANAQAANPDCDVSAVLTGWIAYVDLNQDGVRDAGEAVLLQHDALPATITARSSAASFAVTYLLTGFALQTGGAQIVLCDERGNEATGGEPSSARGIRIAVTGRAGVTRDHDEIQEIIDAIGSSVGGCTVT